MKGKKKMKKYVIDDKALKTVVDHLVGVSVEDFEDEGDGIMEAEEIGSGIEYEPNGVAQFFD